MENQIRPCSFCPFCSIMSRFAKSDVREHLYNARKEVLLAVKSLIEKEIGRTEKAKGGEEARKVEVG